MLQYVHTALPCPLLASAAQQDTIAKENLAYKTACNSCADLSDCPTCVVTDNRTVATCYAVLDYTTSDEADGTLASLSLEKGYWRVSNVSWNILRCHNPDACKGGVAEMCGGVSCANGYCAGGYMGPCEQHQVVKKCFCRG